MSFRATWAIAKKDLLDALRTLRLLIFILLPIGASLFYRTIFASAGDLATARLVIYDTSGSRLPQVLAQAPPKVGHIEGVRVIIVGSLEELRRVVVEARAVGGIALPSGYDAALIAGQRPTIRLFVNGQLEVSSTQLIRMIEPALRALAGRQPPARIETLIANADSKDVPQPDFDIQRFLLIMFLTVGLTMTAIMIPSSMLVEEKEQRTLGAVLVAQASYADFVAGKGLAGLVYARPELALANDSDRYVPIANAILSGEAYAWNTERQGELLNTVGYPLFLAGVFLATMWAIQIM